MTINTNHIWPWGHPLLLFNVLWVWVWFIPLRYHFSDQTLCNNLWHDSPCLFFLSKAIREQICWTNWFEERQQRLSPSIALPTLTVREETHFQPQSVATFCRDLIGFISISASVCQNICTIFCKMVHFIFSVCCLRVGWADNGDRSYAVLIPNQLHKKKHPKCYSFTSNTGVSRCNSLIMRASQEWKMHLSAGSYTCEDKQGGKLCISQVMTIDTQIVSTPVLLCTVYKTLV